LKNARGLALSTSPAVPNVEYERSKGKGAQERKA